MFKEDITVAGTKIQKQHGDVDCRVFSVAIATSLQHGLSSGPYVQALLRPQLFCEEINSAFSLKIDYCVTCALIVSVCKH